MSIYLDVDCKTSTLYSANYLQNMLFSAAPRVCKLDFMKPSVFTSWAYQDAVQLGLLNVHLQIHGQCIAADFFVTVLTGL